MKRRVVVTGLGVVTACGNDVPTTWQALMNCQSGADYIKKFDAEAYSAKFACEVKNFDPLSFLDKKEARRMGAFTHFALAASDEAVKHSGLVIDESNAEMVGTYKGAEFGHCNGLFGRSTRDRRQLSDHRTRRCRRDDLRRC